MIESGLVIFFGMLFLFIKLPKKWVLRALAYPVFIDLAVSVLVLLIHWGTFSGVMAAAFAGLMTSLSTSAGRWFIGYIENDVYYPGQIKFSTTDLT